MPVDYNYRRGADIPIWEWMSQNPYGYMSYPGAANAYDGVRYIYYVQQVGTTGTTASTTVLLRFDTWSDSWQLMPAPVSSGAGLDVEYDPIRNCLWLLNGTSLTTWQCFNLNLTNLVVLGHTCSPMAWTTISNVALSMAAGAGSSVTLVDERATIGDLVANGAVAIDTETVGVGSTTTSIVAALPAYPGSEGSFGPGMVGLSLRFTSGALSGQRRIVTGITSPTVITTVAFGAAPATGDTFVIELPEATATGGSTTTLVQTGAGWTANLYRDSDVVIIAGTGIGQRRRIGSNTTDTLTLASAVTGNTRTGPFSTAPDATSVFRIVPSSDFLYYQAGGSNALYRIDLAQTSGYAWSALTSLPASTGGGANTMYAQSYAPFQIIAFRGAATATVYYYNIGLATMVTPTLYNATDTFTTGSSAVMLHGRRRLAIFAGNNPRGTMLNLTTGVYEPFPPVPYLSPNVYDGHRSRFVKTVDGVEYVYHWRAGGQEFFRLALEWF